MKKDDRHKTLGYKTVSQEESKIYSGGKKKRKDDTFVIQFVKVNHFEINKKRLTLITPDAKGIVHTKIIK